MEIKKSLRAFSKNMETISKRSEYKISEIEDRIQALKKIPDLEEKFDSINSKLGPDNVEKLRKLVLSANELIDESIPDLVNKKIRKSTQPIFDDLKELKDYTTKLNARTTTTVEEIRILKSLEDDIKDLRVERDKLYKDLTDQETRFLEGIDILKHNIRKKIEDVTDNSNLQITELKKEVFAKITDDVKSIFVNVAQPEFTSLSKSLLSLDNEIKKMKERNKEIEKRVSEIQAPENVKRWLYARMNESEGKIMPEIKALLKNSISHESLLSELSDKSKELETKYKSIPKQLEVHDMTINKLFDARELFSKKSERMESDIRSLFDKLSNEGKKSSSLSRALDDMNERMISSLDDQRDYIVRNKDEQNKHMHNIFSNLKKDFEIRHREEVSRHLREFENEIKRITGLEQGLDTAKRYSEKRIDAADKNISSLQTMPPQIEEIKKRLTEMGQALKGTVPAARFNRSLESVSKQIRENQSIQATLEKTLNSIQNGLQSQINTLLSDDILTKSIQKQIQQNLDHKIQETNQELEKRISDISGRNQENSETVLKLREALNTLKPLSTQVKNHDLTLQELGTSLASLIQLTRNLPSEITRNLEKIDKLEESKEATARQLESLESGGQNIQNQLSTERERVASVESRIQDLSKNHEKRMDRLEENLLSIQDSPSEIEAIDKRLNEIENSGVKLGDKIARNRLDEMKNAEQLKNVTEVLEHVQKKLENLESIHAKLEKRFDTDRSRMDEYLKQSLAEREEVENDMKEQRERLGEMIKAMKQ